jgi:hypothetical protein
LTPEQLHNPLPAASALAIGSSTIAVASGREVAVFDTSDPDGVRRVTLGFHARHLAMAPSGRFLAVAPPHPRRQLAIVESATGAVQQIAAASGERFFGFGFAPHDRLFLAHDRGQLSLYEPGTATLLEERERFSTGGLTVDRVLPLASRWIGIIAHGDGETDDEFITIEDTALGDPDQVLAAFRAPRDRAWRLIAGSASDDSFVAFRDPDYRDGADPGFPSFKGLYRRGLTAPHDLLVQLEWDGPVAAGDDCLSTDTATAVVTRNALHVLDREDFEWSVPIIAGAADLLSRRVAFVDPRGALNLLSLVGSHNAD